MRYELRPRIRIVDGDGTIVPLVEKERGGAAQGGAQLTPAGKNVLQLYRRIEEKAARATEPLWEKMKEQL